MKVAPDLSWAALDEAIECCLESSVAGIIATNTTLGRAGIVTSIDQAGGLSGAPLRARSLEVVRFIGARLGGKWSLIGVGGVATSEDVLAMLAAGASMVQLYTALIYQGPGVVRALNKGLIAFMDRHACRSLAEAIDLWNSLKKVS